MNMQALMKQAQAMQRDITKAKEEIDKTEFTGSSSVVTIVCNGKKEIVSVKIDDKDALDDVGMLEDMIMVAVNDAFKKVDLETEKKLGKYSNMMSGLM